MCLDALILREAFRYRLSPDSTQGVVTLTAVAVPTTMPLTYYPQTWPGQLLRKRLFRAITLRPKDASASDTCLYH